MEKPYQTYERVTGKKWTGGNSADVQSTYKEYGITAPAGSAEANIALQQALNKKASTVDPIQKTVGYASSTSKLGEYNQNSSTLDGKLNIKNGTSAGVVTDATKTGTGISGTENKITPTPTITETKANPKDPQVPAYLDANKVIEDEKAKLDIEYTKKKAESETLYQTQFSNYDQAYSNDVANINSVFSQRMETQKRLDKIDLDRRKAYGLGATPNAQYMPVEYSDAITVKERESADEIKKLDIERSNLLSKAKQARDNGQTNILKENMDRINSLEEKMRIQIKEALTLAQTQNEIAWKNYEKQKADFTKQIQDRAKIAISQFGEEYNKAKTFEEKQAIIAKAIESGGGNPSDPTMFVNIEGAFKTNADTVYKTDIQKQKDSLAIETSKTNNLKKISDMAKNSGGKKITVTEKNKIVADTTADAVLTFKDLASKSATKTLDKKTYNDFIAVFEKEHGANAVLNLNKKLKDNGVKISK